MKAAFRSLGKYILLCYFFSPGIYPRGVVGLGTYGRYARRGGDQGAQLTLSSSTGSTTFLDHEASGGTPLISDSSYAWLPPLPLFLRVRLFSFFNLLGVLAAACRGISVDPLRTVLSVSPSVR